MKISRPGGSSDLDEARAILRRLTARRAPGPAGVAAAPTYVAFERTTRPAPPTPEPAETPAVPARPPWLTPPPGPPAEAEPAPKPLFAFEPEPPDTPLPSEPEPAPAYEPEAEPVGVAQPSAGFTDSSVDALVEGLVTAPPVRRFTPEGVLDDLVPDAPVDDGDTDPLGRLTADHPEALPPSWTDILERCRDLAQAQASLLMDPKGQVMADAGDWPAAGVQAVATKLMPLIEKKEQTSPGSGLSLRFGGKMLAAWTVNHAGRRLTVAFVVDTPLGVVMRRAIEDTLGQGPS